MSLFWTKESLKQLNEQRSKKQTTSADLRTLWLRAVLGSVVWLLMLITLSVLLTSCGWLSTKPQEPTVLPPKENPPMPELVTPLPSETYSSRAQVDITSWQKLLMDMSATSKH